MPFADQMVVDQMAGTKFAGKLENLLANGPNLLSKWTICLANENQVADQMEKSAKQMAFGPHIC